MSKFETRFEADDDAEKIHSAFFFGFLESFADDEEIDGDARISIELDRRGRRVCVRLWSAQAMDDFLKRLSNDISTESARCG